MRSRLVENTGSAHSSVDSFHGRREMSLCARIAPWSQGQSTCSAVGTGVGTNISAASGVSPGIWSASATVGARLSEGGPFRSDFFERGRGTGNYAQTVDAFFDRTARRLGCFHGLLREDERVTSAFTDEKKAGPAA